MEYEAKKLEVQWQNFTRKLLVGKTVRHVRYMSDKEMKDFMWDKKPVVIIFTDGTMLVPQSDDEGNDGGALFYYNEKENKQEVIPVIEYFN